MVKICDIIRECGFDHAVETEIVKFLFLTHNQNSHVCKELLKNMKDGDSLNTILGYAKHVEGTQHSEHLSKVYLDTMKILNLNVKVEAKTQKCNGSNKRLNLKHRSQGKGKSHNKGSCHNCGMNHPPKKCPVVKLAILVIKKAILSHSVDSGREARVRENGSQGSPDVINMRLQVQTTDIKMMTPVGFSLNKTQYRFFSVEVFVQTFTLSQTFSSMKLMVKEFNVCLLT